MSTPVESRLSKIGTVTLSCIMGFAVGVGFSYYTGQVIGFQMGFADTLKIEDAAYRKGEEYGMKVGIIVGHNKAVDERATEHMTTPPAQTEIDKLTPTRPQ